MKNEKHINWSKISGWLALGLLLTLILMIGLSLKCCATNYYCTSSSGNDGNAGTSTVAAWQTLSKINSSFSTFAAGDSIFLKRGDVFYGNINITKSGASGNPIYIGAYGTGPMPVISGFTNITSWTNLGSNIWQSTSAIGTLSSCGMVCKTDSVNLAMGRTPNTGSYYTINSHSGTSWIRSSSINSGTHNWTNAVIVGRYINTYWNNYTVTNNDGDTLFNTSASSAANVTPTDGYGFFLQNDASTLDVQNEWYYDAGTFKLKMYSTANPGTVMAATQSDLISCPSTKSYITITGIAFIGASYDGIHFQGSPSYITITNCYFHLIGNNAIELQTSSSNCLLKNNVIKNCGQGGIFNVGGTGSVCNNNNVDSVGVILGQGEGYNIHAEGIVNQSTNGQIDSNVISHTGAACINGWANSEVKYNYLTYGCLKISDMGLIYSSYHQNGSEIAYNIGRYCYGFGDGSTAGNVGAEGIYLDEGAEHQYVHDNYFSECQDYGFKLHSKTSGSPSSDSNNIRNNLFYNNGNGQMYIQNTNGGLAMLNDTLRQNICFATGSSQRTLYLQDQNNSPTTILVSDSNYFVQPFSGGKLLTYQSSSTTNDYSTIASWTSVTNQDGHSITSPKVLTDTTGNIIYLINPTFTPINIGVSNAYIDSKSNNNNTGIITLAPFTAYAAFKNGSIVLSASGKKLYGNFKTK